MKTSIQILVAAIAAGVVSAEQLVEAKKMALEIAPKYLMGEMLTKDEELIFAYVTKQVKKAKETAGKFAETEASKAAAEAAYKLEVQKHKLEVNNLFAAFLQTNNKAATAKTEKTVLFENKVAIKAHFDAFLKSLPVEPKKPGTGKTNAGTKASGTTVWNKPLDINKLKDGSTTQIIWAAIVAAEGGLTKEELEAIIAAKFPERGAANHKVAVYDATHGKLPLKLEGDKFIANLPEVELEVVEPVVEPEVAAK